MKSSFLFTNLLFALSLVALSSCSNKRIAIENHDDSGDSIEEVSQEPDAVDQRTVTGSFRSVSGVMDELSCYCSNGGYVTTEDDEMVAVCFDEEVESCPKITVTGYRTSKKIESNGACPAGMMGFLKVQEYIIGETDY